MRGIVIAVLAVAVRTATAQPKAPPNPAADAALEEGRKLYNVQDWDAAIAKFKEAYTLRPDSASLFNIAQSYRLKGDCAAAAIQYRTYRRSYPNEKNIDKVEKFIVEMDDCAAKTQATTKPPPVEPTVEPEGKNPKLPPTQPPPPPPAAPKASPVLRWGGLTAIGVGVIGLGLGGKYAVDGNDFEDDFAKVCAVSCTSAHALQIERDGNAANRKAWVFTAAGGVALIGGVVMVLLSRHAAESSPVALVPTSDGATLVFGGSL